MESRPLPRQRSAATCGSRARTCRRGRAAAGPRAATETQPSGNSRPNAASSSSPCGCALSPPPRRPGGRFFLRRAATLRASCRRRRSSFGSPPGTPRSPRRRPPASRRARGGTGRTRRSAPASDASQKVRSEARACARSLWLEPNVLDELPVLVVVALQHLGEELGRLGADDEAGRLQLL